LLWFANTHMCYVPKVLDRFRLYTRLVPKASATSRRTDISSTRAVSTWIRGFGQLLPFVEAFVCRHCLMIKHVNRIRALFGVSKYHLLHSSVHLSIHAYFGKYILDMASEGRLMKLCAFIHDNVAKVDACIKEKNLPEPSFDASCPPVLNLPSEVDDARNKALEALDELRDHLLGPVGVVMSSVMNVSCGSGISPTSLTKSLSFRNSSVSKASCITTSQLLSQLGQRLLSKTSQALVAYTLMTQLRS
jgi:hypothetical protein